MTSQYPVLDPISIQPPPISINEQAEEFKEPIAPEIIHTVSPCDTLYGISLQYDIPIDKLQLYNNLHTEEIYYMKELRIPNPSKIINIWGFMCFFKETVCFPPYNDEDVMQTRHRQFFSSYSS